VVASAVVVDDWARDPADELPTAVGSEPHPANATTTAENSPIKQIRWHLPTTSSVCQTRQLRSAGEWAATPSKPLADAPPPDRY